MPVMVVTGASSGIGRAVAEAALAAGWQVALLARRAGRLEVLAAGWPERALALVCDVRDEAAVMAAFGAVVERFGRVDVLFNNAGVFPRGALIDEISLEDWTETLAVNVTGMFLCARAAFAQMRAQEPQGGRIINNGSIASEAPRPGSVCYTTSKHAVTGLTRTLALDGRPFGIAAGQIDVGNARTDLTAGVAAGALQADGTQRPEPMMEARDVAAAVLHMAGMPAGANVLRMTVMATAMPFVGRG
jgi:NADP-dependent 3-hydroxy acid dehydrogenase YdfG